MSKQKTQEEVRAEFFDYVWSHIDYWAGERGSNVPEEYTTRKRLEGFAHSLLATLDGSSMGFPSCHVIAMPHPEDEAYCKENGEDWYNSEGTDLGGALHESLYGHPWPTNSSPRNPLT